MDVDITCRSTMCNIYRMLKVMYETDEESDRDVAQQSELERHSDVRTDVRRKVRWDYVQSASRQAAL